MCPAVHIPTRSWLRSSSTPEPSDPLYSVVFLFLSITRKENKKYQTFYTALHEAQQKNLRKGESKKLSFIPSKRGNPRHRPTKKPQGTLQQEPRASSLKKKDSKGNSHLPSHQDLYQLLTRIAYR